MKNSLLSVIIVLAISCGGQVENVETGSEAATCSACAGPLQEVYAPLAWIFAGASVDVVMGTYTSTQKQIAIFRNRATLECVETVVSNSAANWDHDVVVYLSSGDDTFLAAGSAGAYIVCQGGNGTPLGPIVNTRQGLYVYGNSGADVIKCDFPCFAHGGAGNDTLSTTAPSSALYGEDGNDTLRSSVTRTDIFGGAGDDCVSIPYDSQSFVDCGPGSDRLVGASPSVSSCESGALFCGRLSGFGL